MNNNAKCKLQNAKCKIEAVAIAHYVLGSHKTVAQRLRFRSLSFCILHFALCILHDFSRFQTLTIGWATSLGDVP